MATLLDPADEEVRTAAESHREILLRLEATPFVVRLEAALAVSSDRTGLSGRAQKKASTAPHVTTR